MDPNATVPQGENIAPPQMPVVPEEPTAPPVAPQDMPPAPVDVNPVMPPQESVATPQEPSKKSSPLGVIAIILLIIAILAVAGYFVYTKYLSNMSTSVSTPTPIAIVTPIPTPDPTVNWKAYKDINLGIQFKYPQGWSIVENQYASTSPQFETGVISQTRKGNQASGDLIGYTFQFQKDTLENFNALKAYDTTKSLGTTTLSGLIFEKYIVSDLYLSFNYIYKNSNNEVYRFNIYPYEEGVTPASLINTVDQVVSTFKFIEASASSSTQ